MSNEGIRLTAEQRECVNFPLSHQVLIVNAGPGTGKTEIIKERMRFIVEQNLNQQQLALVLTFNKNISVEIWRKLKLIISKNVTLLQKNNQFLKRSNFSPHQVMNRTFHSLCYLIFNEEQEKISGKENFEIFMEKRTKEYFFPFWTDSAFNFVEHIKDKMKSFLRKPANELRFKILNNLSKCVLNKKSNNVGEKLRGELMWEGGIWKKIGVNKEKKPLIYQKIAYDEYLWEVRSVLEKSGRLDLYEPIKEFFISDQRKRFWLFFDDVVENVTNFLKKDEEKKKRWQVFNHILVDESQDLNEEQLRMIKQLCLPHTTLTFVGDPKQTIYEFRGAKSGIFETIKKLFPNNIQKNVTESFRSHQEIIAVANDFSQNFLGAWHYTDLKSRKAGEKPVVFLSEDSQKQIDFVVEQIDQIQEPARKAILYYQNKTGKKIAEELRKRNIDFIGLKDKDNEGARIIERLKFLKVEEKAGEFFSTKNLLEKSNISLTDPDIVDFVEDYDNGIEIERQLWKKGDKLTPFQAKRFIQELEDFTFHRFLVNNPKDKVGRIILSTIHGSKGLEFDHVFLVDVNEEILPGKNINNAEEELEKARIFYVGVTRAKKKLYLCSSDREEISQFLLKIDPKLVEIRTSKVDFLKTTSSPSAQKKEEIIGVEGEEKVYDLLVESQIPFLKLAKNWEEIPNLQIDIYAETTTMVYFVEVKNWSWNYYSNHREEILKQQFNREQAIEQDWQRTGKEINKKFTYVICFFYWKMAQDFRDFYQQIQNEKKLNEEKILFAFYEKSDEEFTFFADPKIKRIEKWIKAIEEKYDPK